MTTWISAFSAVLYANTFIAHNNNIQLYYNVGFPILPLDHRMKYGLSGGITKELY